MTGNDGSQSVVTISQVAGQSITNLENLYCTYSGTCMIGTTSGRTLDFDDDGNKDYLLTMEDKTNEGSKFTLTSLDPSIVTVSKSTCKNTNCSNSQKNQQVWMLHFQGFGKAKVVATAAAVTGFRAMQDTFEIEYRKGEQRFDSRFKNQKLAFGATSTTGLASTTLSIKTPITYTYNGQPTSPYLTRQGEGYVAGTQNAVIAVTANVPETDFYAAATRTVTFIIGDSASAVNLKEYNDYVNPSEPISIKPVKKITNSLQASMKGSTLQFTTKNTGLVKIDIYDALGASVKQMSDVYGKGSHAIDLKGLANGSYTLIVRQGSSKASIRWMNK